MDQGLGVGGVVELWLSSEGSVPGFAGESDVGSGERRGLQICWPEPLELLFTETGKVGRRADFGGGGRTHATQEYETSRWRC